ncbi:MAG: tRNA (N6-threonylcarbamoyladenosine(37)-N6)-methyltransferase TrmO [Candidatus Odinarchaeota archaeon]
MKNYKIFPVGFVRKTDDKHWVEILPDYRDGLYRLEMISHVFILWWIHERDVQVQRKAEISVPRVFDSHEPPQEMGTFATRAPMRPNPIGLTLTRVISIDDLEIVVDHIDAFDGTPVIDIKPYLPNGDSIDGKVKLPPWFEHLQEPRPFDRSNAKKS